MNEITGNNKTTREELGIQSGRQGMPSSKGDARPVMPEEPEQLIAMSFSVLLF